MKRLYRIRLLLGVFLIATLAALGVRLFIVEDYRVASPSMVPSLVPGDLIFVSKAAFNLRLPFSSYELFRFRSPRRGEVVAFTLPGRGNETFVKRVVALEGEKVSIRQGEVQVSGLSVSYRDRQSHYWWENLDGAEHLVLPDAQSNYGPIDVPPGHFFVLGDNRQDSIDSRKWGPIPYSSLKGRVALIWLSVDEGGSMRRDRMGLAVH